MDTTDLLERLRALREDHNEIISNVESARARVVSVEALYEQLTGKSPERDELMRMAIGCVEHDYYRPAIVMAWAAVVDRIVEVLGLDGYERLRSTRTKWVVGSRDELIERYPESQILDALLDAGFVRRRLHRTLQGQLHQRNQAAHAGPYRPTFNITLGYIEGALSSLKELEAPL